jgi:hypothetical protein
VHRSNEITGRLVPAATKTTAERAYVIIPACGCDGPREPLYSTRGLERCTVCGAIVQPRRAGRQSEDDKIGPVATPPEEGDSN